MHTIYQRTAIARFLLVLWGLLCFNNIVFRHAHQLPDGRIITHSHPYLSVGSKCPYPAHRHTENELAWLDYLSTIQFDTPSATFIFSVLPAWLTPQLSYSYIEKDSLYRIHWFFLRGPPDSIS